MNEPLDFEHIFIKRTAHQINMALINGCIILLFLKL